MRDEFSTDLLLFNSRTLVPFVLIVKFSSIVSYIPVETPSSPINWNLFLSERKLVYIELVKADHPIPLVMNLIEPSSELKYLILTSGTPRYSWRVGGIRFVVLNVLVAASHEANIPSIMSPTGCLSATSNMFPSFPILNIPSDSLNPNMKFCSVPRSTSIPAKPAVTPAPVSPSLIRIMLSRTSTLSA